MIRGETGCTLYRSNGIGFDRFYIGSCHWQENKAKNVLKSGLQNADSLTVYIYAEDMYITPSAMVLPPVYPAVEVIPHNTTKDMLVKGNCDFVFDNTSLATVSECMKAFRQKYTFHTVTSVDYKLYGGKNMQHIKVSAR
jgi:hypothetical protein